MTTSKLAIALALCLALVLPEPALAVSKSDMREIGEKLQSAADAAQTSDAYSPTRCFVGFVLAHDSKTVMSVGQEAYGLGVREGDVYLSINDILWEPEDPQLIERLVQIAKGDEITIKLSRGPEIVVLSGTCPHDDQERGSYWRSIIPTLLKDNPEACLKKLSRVEKHFGVDSNTFASRNTCTYRYFEKSKWRKGTRADYGALVLRQNLFLIESASYRYGALDDIKPKIMSSLTWFDNAGQSRYSRELERSFETALAAESTGNFPGHESVAGAYSTGTCFAVSSDGLVLTSEHVVAGADKITIRFENEDPVSATVESSSASVDLALLKVGRNTRDYLGLAPMKSAQSGDEVFTYGYPVSDVLGMEPKFTDGTISALSGPGGEAAFLQMSVPIQPGNSGGPVVNSQGQLIGVVAASAAIEPFLRNTGSLPQNVNWAVKADYAHLMFDAMGRPPAANRQEALELTRRSICFVEARQ